MKNGKSEIILDTESFEKTLNDMAERVTSDLGGDPDLVMIGIRTRGVPLANKLKKLIQERTGKDIPMGILDITLYRDDLSTLAHQPIVQPTQLPFDVDGKKIILVDDVIYTGRTIRAALDEIIDFGRPAQVKLAVLMDRGWREYPIQPDYTGKKIETKKNQVVQVRLKEIDGEEKVMLTELNGV